MARRERKLYDHIFEQPYEATGFAYPEEPEAHPQYSRLKGFVDTYGLAQKRCLEIGIGRAAFQNLVPHNYGIDIALSVGKLATSPFAVASATDLPFPANCFDGVWTLHVLEHVAQPERGLQEIWRVLRPGGYMFIIASWQVGLWAAKGYQVRPFSDFDWKGKVIKASVPVRNSVWFRVLRILPKRLWRLMTWRMDRRPTQLDYKELEPDLEDYVGPDSSAASSLDPFEVYFWFRSRGAICLNYPTLPRGLFIRTGALILHKPTSVSGR